MIMMITMTVMKMTIFNFQAGITAGISVAIINDNDEPNNIQFSGRHNCRDLSSSACSSRLLHCLSSSAIYGRWRRVRSGYDHFVYDYDDDYDYDDGSMRMMILCSLTVTKYQVKFGLKILLLVKELTFYNSADDYNHKFFWRMMILCSLTVNYLRVEGATGDLIQFKTETDIHHFFLRFHLF